MPLYPSKVLRAKERASTPCFFVIFCLGFTFESLKELGARHMLQPKYMVSITNDDPMKINKT
jgi:hypothetical protein